MNAGTHTETAETYYWVYIIPHFSSALSLCKHGHVVSRISCFVDLCSALVMLQISAAETEIIRSSGVFVCVYLCHAAEAGVGFRGSDLQSVEVVSALVVDHPGEAERPALLVDAEQIPRIHQQHVGQTLLLEGDGLNGCNATTGTDGCS